MRTNTFAKAISEVKRAKQTTKRSESLNDYLVLAMNILGSRYVDKENREIIINKLIKQYGESRVNEVSKSIKTDNTKRKSGKSRYLEAFRVKEK